MLKRPIIKWNKYNRSLNATNKKKTIKMNEKYWRLRNNKSNIIIIRVVTLVGI